MLLAVRFLLSESTFPLIKAAQLSFINNIGQKSSLIYQKVPQVNQ